MKIFKTTNKINGKIYIGQTVKTKESYFGSGIYLMRAIKKYGRKNFKREILSECSTQEHLDILERYWIKKLNAKDPNIGYNIADGGVGRGKHSEKTKRKISKSLTGKKLSNEHKLNLSKAREGLRIGPPTRATKRKMSEARKLWWSRKK